MSQPIIQTDRLTLRPFRSGDAAALAAALNQFAVSRWLGVVPHPYSADDARSFVDRAVTEWPWKAAVTHDNRLIGCMDVENGSLGYWLSKAVWGQGYATEAARALVDHYFRETPEAATIHAGYFAGNHGSANVLRKLGFVPTGQHVLFCVPQNRELAHIQVQLTRDAWQALQ